MKQTMKKKVLSQKVPSPNKIWVLEAQMGNTAGKPWIIADFFKMGSFTMPYTAKRLRDAQRMKREICRAFYENWTIDELRITAYVAKEREAT